jgi:hypothetical protein
MLEGVIQFEPVTVNMKDGLLFFFMALALKRGRIAAMLDKVLPSEETDG